MWGKEVSSLYSQQPEYVQELTAGDSVRNFYPKQALKDGELIATLTRDEVSWYNPFLEDVATLDIYFGSSSTLGEQYHHKQRAPCVRLFQNDVVQQLESRFEIHSGGVK